VPKRDEAPIGAPCWVDLFTSDPDRARAFYGELLGWTSEDMGEDYGNYINFLKDGAGVAGGMRNDGSDGIPDHWNIYLAVTDAKETVDKAVAAGAQAIVGAMDVMDLGVMAVLADPGQAGIGVWQPGSHKGFGLLGEPGAPGWFELHTRDYDASVRFYTDVFGWDARTMGDSPEFRYTTNGEGESATAGIMDASGFLPEGVPAHWRVYFAVADTDAAVATLTALGGSVVQPAEDTPYGRLVQVADPTGAAFSLMGPNNG
jgi:predicted enzyme related to lactoylglutathione lyase